jgi:FixJ family two-component response regulator
LLRASGYEVKSYESATAFLGELPQEAAGCVLADLQMPDLDGLALQEALGRAPNPLPVIFLTGQGDIPSTVKAMRGGAEDFLTKTAPKEKILEAINRALARDVQSRQRRSRLKALRERFAALSARELEVLGHVVRGRLNKQIAAELGITERTVKLHRTNITRTLDVHSVAELTRMAQEAGLIAEE